MNAEERKNAELVERFMRGAGVHESFWAETPFPKLQRYLISLGMPSDDVNDAGTKDELLLLIAKFAVFENGVMVIQGAVRCKRARWEMMARKRRKDEEDRLRRRLEMPALRRPRGGLSGAS